MSPLYCVDRRALFYWQCKRHRHTDFCHQFVCFVIWIQSIPSWPYILARLLELCGNSYTEHHVLLGRLTHACMRMHFQICTWTVSHLWPGYEASMIVAIPCSKGVWPRKLLYGHQQLRLRWEQARKLHISRECQSSDPILSCCVAIIMQGSRR